MILLFGRIVGMTELVIINAREQRYRPAMNRHHASHQILLIRFALVPVEAESIKRQNDNL
jgi:hypothetical protein